MSPKFEKVMNPKKLSLMFLWSLYCLEIPPGIFSSNHCTVKLLKQNNTRGFRSVCYNNTSEFPGTHIIYTALAGTSRNSLERIFCFNFPGRCWYNRLWYNMNLLGFTELKKIRIFKEFYCIVAYYQTPTIHITGTPLYLDSSASTILNY